MSVNKIWMHNYLFESNFIFHSLFLSGRALTRRQCGWWDRWFPACPAPFRARCLSWRGRCWRVGTTSLSLPRASRRRTATSRGQLAAEAVELTWQAGVAWVLVCFFLFLFWEIMQLSPYTVRVVKSHSCNRVCLFFEGVLPFPSVLFFRAFFFSFFRAFHSFWGGVDSLWWRKENAVEHCWPHVAVCVWQPVAVGSPALPVAGADLSEGAGRAEGGAAQLTHVTAWEVHQQHQRNSG